MLQILIADNNIELCDIIAEYLNGQSDMEVSGIAYDGEEALILIDRLKPDVVILDITMPRLDGMAVLEQLRAKNLVKMPVIIVLTAVGREDIIHRFVDLGADYYIVKPFDLKCLANRIRQFTKQELTYISNSQPDHTTGIDAEMQVTRILNSMGVPPNLKGYKYMRDAVLLAINDEQLLINSFNKGLYTHIAMRYAVTPDSIEVAIRHATMTAWENGNRAYIAQLLDARDVTRFPTNTLLLCKLTDAVKRGDHLADNYAKNGKVM